MHYAKVVMGRQKFKFTAIQRKISLSLSNLFSLTSKSLSSEVDSMIVEQGSCENMDTSSTDPTNLLILLETTDEHSADDMLMARWSPILFRMSPQEQSSPNLSSDEMPAEMGPEMPLSRAPNYAAPMSNMMHLTDTSDEQESDSEVSIITEGGYLADIESAAEIEYTTEPELYQEEILAICAAQRELNGHARLALFRIPPKKCGICPICKIGGPKNK